MCEAPDRPGRTIGSSGAELATSQSVWNSGTRVVPGGTAFGLERVEGGQFPVPLGLVDRHPTAGRRGRRDGRGGDADGVALGADEAVGVGEALADALGDVPAAGPNVNQFRFTKSDVEVLFMTAKTVCAPAGTADAFAVTVVHFCQPPVCAIGKLASSWPSCAPRCSSTVPPVALCEETRAVRSTPVIDTSS